MKHILTVGAAVLASLIATNAQTISTTLTGFLGSLPAATLPLAGSEIVTVAQGGALRGAPLAAVRGGTGVSVSGTPVAGDGACWVSPTMIGGCGYGGVAVLLAK